MLDNGAHSKGNEKRHAFLEFANIKVVWYRRCRIMKKKLQFV